MIRLRFALFNETTKQMEKHLDSLNSESLEVGFKIHKGKTKYMTNHADSEEMLIDEQKIEKVIESKYLGQNKHLKDTTYDTGLALKTQQMTPGHIYMPGSEQRGAVLEKNKEILQDRQLPISLKNK